MYIRCSWPKQENPGIQAVYGHFTQYSGDVSLFSSVQSASGGLLLCAVVVVPQALTAQGFSLSSLHI